MALEPGTQLGSFGVTRQLGAGGMGEVYLATDSKLGREVAIKVLPESLARDRELLARFEREARLLAALDHPNICTVYELQEADGTRFIVMQYLKGSTLSRRMARGPMPFGEALPIFVQIAEALEAAHEQGIIHRDLKPNNIIVSEDGKVKVLDFGLGKLAESEAGRASGSASTHAATPDSATVEGLVLGTPGYMSPEQARGKPVDKRTDIWAFGCCLYEALTGDLPFKGETVSDTLARVLEREPDLERLRPDTPPQVRALLRKCLQKDSSQRLRDIGDARIDMQDLITESGRVRAVARKGPAAPGRSYVVAASIVLGAVLGTLIIAAALAFTFRLQRSTPGPSARAVSRFGPQTESVRRYSITLSPDAPLQAANNIGRGSGMALSPDGLLFVYVASTGPGTTQLFLRRLGQLDAQPIAETEGASEPFFSPDSQWIGFFAPGKLKKVSVLGGSSFTLCDVPRPLGASWGEDDHIVFSSELREGLKRIAAAGGPVEDLMDASFMGSHGFVFVASPVVLPGGKTVLFTSVAGLSMNDLQIGALSLETGEVQFLLERATCYGYVPTGHLLYGQEGAMMAAPFDTGTLEITGPAVPVTEAGMKLHPQINSPIQFSLSGEGLLVYAPGADDPDGDSVARTLVWVDRSGNEQLLAAPTRPYTFVDLSPDGTHVVVLLADERDIWILDLTRKPATLQRLTIGLQMSPDPVWMPDSRRVVFSVLRDGMLNLSWKAANGAGPVVPLYTSENDIWAYACSPDGKYLIFNEQSSPSNTDIWVLSLDGEAAARPLLAESYSESGQAISPDGRWMAYISDESGQYNIYVRPFPNVDDGKWLISTHGGGWPVWAPNGRELFYYASPSQMMVVTVETAPTFAAGDPEVLFEAPYYVVPGKPYDVSPYGQRFLMIKDATPAREGDEAAEAEPITELVVVENWDVVLKAVKPSEEPQ